jgi:hypothetical protein
VHPDLREDARLLAGIERVVDRLLHAREQRLAGRVEPEEVAVLGKELADRDVALAGGEALGGGPALRGSLGRGGGLAVAGRRGLLLHSGGLFRLRVRCLLRGWSFGGLGHGFSRVLAPRL